MNTLERLNAVIDYAEKHITEKLDLNILARLACCSLYDFQRMFGFITGMSAAEYIRKRRLTLAGTELRYRGASVTDTALKYCYESPVSFARAFQAFHGFTPREAKKSDAALKVFPRLAFQIIVKEVQEMNITNKIFINGKDYGVTFLLEKDISDWQYEDYVKLRTWRIEDGACEDIKNHKNTLMTGNVLTRFDTFYQTEVKAGQAFVIEYARQDGSLQRLYHLAEGEFYEGKEFTREYQGICTRVDKMNVGGKEYDASYFGELDMSSWTEDFKCREFWRLEDAYDDFRDKPQVGGNIIPYSNFPMSIETGQVFVIQYNKKDGSSYKSYLRSDGFIWHNEGEELPSNTEFYVEPPKPERVERLNVGGKEYEASYFPGHARGIWRLEDAYDDFKDKQRTGDVLPYNNYSFPVEEMQVFALEFKQEDGTIEYGYYISEPGVIWKDMPSTVQVNLEHKAPEKTEIRTVGGKEYQASYLRTIELKNIPDWDAQTSLPSEIYDTMDIWRLENAYADLKSTVKTGDAVPYDCLPIHVENETAYAIDYNKKDGSAERRYYVTDGTIWNNELAAAEISAG